MSERTLCGSLLTLTILVAVLLGFLPLRAQGVVEVSVNQVDSADFPLVRATVTVIDENGIAIHGLDSSDIQILEDGLRVPINSVTPVTAEGAAISTALLIDISRSMAMPDEESIDDAKVAATNFVTQLGVQDYVAIVAFGSEVDLGEPFPQIDRTREMDFTDDEDALSALIAGLVARDDWTALYDAIFKGVRMTSRRPAGNRAVIVFTDGREDAPKTDEPGGSTLDREAPISEALRYGIPVFTIGLGTAIDDAYLAEVALRTGGTYTSTQDSAALTRLFRGVLERLKLRYVVEYSSSVLADGEDHTLQIQVGAGGTEDKEITTFQAGLPDVPAVRGFFSWWKGERDQQLQDSQQIHEPLKIAVRVDHRDVLDRVEYYVDGTALFTTTAEPYVFLWDTSSYEPLTHTVMVRAYDVDGDVGSGSIDLLVPAVPTAESLSWEERLARHWWVIGGVALMPVMAVALFVGLYGRRRDRSLCRQCGQRLETDWRKCPNCGASIWVMKRAPILFAVGAIIFSGFSGLTTMLAFRWSDSQWPWSAAALSAFWSLAGVLIGVLATKLIPRD